MTSINSYYTLKYEQPAEYHFSHDSVFLARRAYELTEQDKPDRVLDLCSGCGIVGIDYIFHRQKNLRSFPSRIDFLELQKIYQKYFANNIAQISGLQAFEFLNKNYGDVFISPELKNVYDLILCNPPYFNRDQGKLSPSDFKNRCRFFIDSDFKSLLNAIHYLLKPYGTAYILVKNEDELKPFNSEFKITRVEMIRNTALYQLQPI